MGLRAFVAQSLQFFLARDPLCGEVIDLTTQLVDTLAKLVLLSGLGAVALRPRVGELLLERCT